MRIILTIYINIDVSGIYAIMARLYSGTVLPWGPSTRNSLQGQLGDMF